MREALKVVLSIQEYDIKMIRLMKLKKQRQDQLMQLAHLQAELAASLENKQVEIKGVQEECSLLERRVDEHKERIKKLESQQLSIKKIEEFNALTKEISTLERERSIFEQTLSHLVDKKALEDELFEKTKKSLAESEESSKGLEKEIHETIREINAEGRALLRERTELIKTADQELLSTYERLLKNKRDRVIVPIENRTCAGCQIALTAQHENLVRKAEKLIFCEHCSRIHYWPEEKVEESEVAGPKRRRRKVSA